MSEPRPVLYAEDDENDVFLMERAFGKCHVPNPLRNTPDGTQAVAYLSANEPFKDRRSNPLPCLVLLDLSMPGKHGLEVLKWMKNEPAVASVPVVIFSSSSQRSDIRKAYDLGANGFMVKPGDPTELINIVKVLQEYWLTEPKPKTSFFEFAGDLVIPPPKPDSLV